MTRLRAFLVAAILLIPVLASAGAAEVRLVAPSAGGMLRGGETAVLAWEAGALPAGSEEWEAFLSVDGGRHYAIRVTPHLDVHLRRVSWTVPNVSAGDVRLLLRFGNERNEREVEIGASFSIEGCFNGLPLWPDAASSYGRGEEARRGDGGVSAWVAGDRHGKHSRLVTARGPETFGSAEVSSRASDREPAAALQRAPCTSPAERSWPLLAQTIRPPPRDRSFAAATADRLLASHRLNI